MENHNGPAQQSSRKYAYFLYHWWWWIVHLLKWKSRAYFEWFEHADVELREFDAERGRQEAVRQDGGVQQVQTHHDQVPGEHVRCADVNTGPEHRQDESSTQQHPKDKEEQECRGDILFWIITPEMLLAETHWKLHKPVYEIKN